MLSHISLAVGAYLIGMPWGEGTLPRGAEVYGGRPIRVERAGVLYHLRIWTDEQWRALPLPDRPRRAVQRGRVVAVISRVGMQTG